MAYEQKEGQGSLFVADQQGNPNRPNYRGSIMINGQMYWVSGWLKQTKSGDQFISLSAELPQQRPQTPQGGFPQQGFQQAGQFPQAPVNQPYPQQQGYQQYPGQPQAPQYPQSQPQGNPFGAQPPQSQPAPAPMPGLDDMPAF